MTFFIIDKFVDVKLIGYGLLTFSLTASTSFVLYYIYIYIYIDLNHENHLRVEDFGMLFQNTILPSNC